MTNEKAHFLSLRSASLLRLLSRFFREWSFRSLLRLRWRVCLELSYSSDLEALFDEGTPSSRSSYLLGGDLERPGIVSQGSTSDNTAVSIVTRTNVFVLSCILLELPGSFLDPVGDNSHLPQLSRERSILATPRTCYQLFQSRL